MYYENTTNYPFPRTYPMKTNPNPAYSAMEAGYHMEAVHRARIRIMEKLEREALIAQAQEDGIGIVHVYSPEYPKGGLTCAFMKCTEYEGDVMVEVAVNVCSDKDSFSKKIGTYGALEKFYLGETILLPLLRKYRAEDLNFAVKNAFTMMYFLD